MQQLVLNDGTEEAKAYNLPSGSMTIGRTQDNEIWILHPSLSRQHARVDVDGEAVTLSDLGSRNGTFVNGTRIERWLLSVGDEVKLGDVVLRYVKVALTLSLAVSAPTVDTLAEFTARRSSSLPQDKLRIMLEVSRLLSSPDVAQILPEKILDLIGRILDIDRAALLVVNDATGDLEPRARKTNTPTDRLIYSQHIVEYVRKEGVATLFADAQTDARVANAHSIAEQSIRASMCAPLKTKDGVIGVLYVDHKSRSNRFTQDDLELLAAFASQAAVALENVRLYQQLEKEAVQRSQLLRYFPPNTIQRVMLAGGPSRKSAEVEVTALFSDISDFTAMSSSLQPAEIVALLNDYFPVMADIVFRHEGTLEKYIGDAIMAVWGAPFAHDDDADRAVCAAVAMQQALRKLNAEWSGKGARPPLRIHLGLNTGPVVAGFIGSQSYLQYAAIGDATNVASRVCAVAPPGGLYITESTWQKLRNKDLPIEKQPAAFVKGKSQALSLYRVRWEELPVLPF